MSVPKRSGVCSKRNTPAPSRFDLGQAQARMEASLLSMQPLILAFEGAKPIRQIQNHADPCQVHTRIAPLDQLLLQTARVAPFRWGLGIGFSMAAALSSEFPLKARAEQF